MKDITKDLDFLRMKDADFFPFVKKIEKIHPDILTVDKIEVNKQKRDSKAGGVLTREVVFNFAEGVKTALRFKVEGKEAALYQVKLGAKVMPMTPSELSDERKIFQAIASYATEQVEKKQKQPAKKTPAAMPKIIPKSTAVATADERLKAAEQAASDEQAAMEEIKDQISNLTGQKTANETELETLQDQLTDLERQSAALQEQIEIEEVA